VSELNKSIAAAIIHAAGSPNWPAMTAGYSRDAVYHGAAELELKGREAIVALAQSFKAAYPDMKFVVQGQRATDDVVVTKFTALGMNTGELNGSPPTGKRIMVDLTTTQRFERGRVVEEWSTWDEMATALDFAL
jgi:predicted ester cyclase